MAVKKTAGLTKRILLTVILFGPALIMVFVGLQRCNHKFKVLDDYGVATNYQFTDAQGRKHKSEDFKGKIVLVTTLQPTCPENCAIAVWPLNHSIYQKIRKNKKKLGSVRIISFVTDGEGNPLKDLSAVDDMLRDQIEGYDPDIWMLASGDPKQLYDFEHNDQELLQQGDEYYGGEAYQELMLLLDKENHLRMVLPGTEEGLVRRMKEHVALLRKQYDKEAANGEKSK
jgi:cytochrome oxidase Cu insertion factor (SCO1/SenC/PrrC family)